MFLNINTNNDIFTKKYLFAFEKINSKLLYANPNFMVVAKFYKFKDVNFNIYILIICLLRFLNINSEIYVGEKFLVLDKTKRNKFIHFYIKSLSYAAVANTSAWHALGIIYNFILLYNIRRIKYKNFTMNKVFIKNDIFTNLFVPLQTLSKIYPLNLFSIPDLFKYNINIQIYISFNNDVFWTEYFIKNFNNSIGIITKII